MNKEQFQNALSNTDGLNTDIVLVFNTYKNISKKRLRKLIFNLHNRVNKKFCRYFRKRLDKRIKLYVFPENKPKNRHAHALIDIPNDFNKREVLEEFETVFRSLDDRKGSDDVYTVFYEPARTEIGNVNYSSKGYNQYREQQGNDTFWVM